MAEKAHSRSRTARFQRSITTVERDTEAARLLEQGHSYDEIAEELGFSSRGNAWRAVQRVLRDVPVKAVSQLRAREFARLELLWESLLPGIEAGDVPSINAGRKLSESMRKMFDLDAQPLETEPTGAGDSEMEQLVREAEQIVASEMRKIYGGDD
jgi:hypothetical protein